jgi:phosphoribosylaminoimidazolecarboxamide formyltransferase/IMP cyclohydrolase
MSRVALLSVSDKTGLLPLAQALVGAGYELLSTGGTAGALRAAGLSVTEVSEHTGHPEIFDGRVKTLHPRVHGGILGKRDAHAAEAEAHGLRWIDVVVVNLYPFAATAAREGVSEADVIEQIDIGGPSMLRSAAKNHAWVTVVVDPNDYTVVAEALAAGGADADLRRRLAVRAFEHTAAYDATIAGWLGRPAGAAPALPVEGAVALTGPRPLRYGENPHQRAVFFPDPLPTGRALGRARQLQGDPLSFNNLADLDAAVRGAFELDGPACMIIKHMNPCGAAEHPDGPAAAFELALSADPISAYGGIVAFNRPVDADAARALRRGRTFFECLVAPGFTEEALALLAPRERLRVLELPGDWAAGRPPGFDARRVMGGWLLQDWDVGLPVSTAPGSDRAPTDPERALLDFAWRVARGVKSNAIVLATAADGGFVLNGCGAGQMSRVDSVGLAVQKATRPVDGNALASDAFFPFADGVERALAAGVRAFIQPGGSIRDAEVRQAVDAAGATMLLTGARHFRH